MKYLSSMQCPNDHQKLSLANAETRTGWKCKSCKGIWLPSNFITSFQYTHSGFVEKLYEQLKNKTESTTNRSCPEGHGRLKKSIYVGTHLDWCVSCNGVWFDQGELRTVTSLADKDAGINAEAGWPVVVIDTIVIFGLFVCD